MENRLNLPPFGFGTEYAITNNGLAQIRETYLSQSTNDRGIFGTKNGGKICYISHMIEVYFIPFSLVPNDVNFISKGLRYRSPN